MADWFVRPDTTHGATRNGASYGTAWGGWGEIVWGGSGVKAGDTLYVCGTHNRNTTTFGAHGGTSSSPVTIRGDYQSAPGIISITVWGHFEVNTAWTTLMNLRVNSTVTSDHAIYVKVDGARFMGCTVTGGIGGIYADNVLVSMFEVIGCDISGTSEAAVRYMLQAGSVTATGITISNNTVHDNAKFGIDVRVAGAAGTTSYINNVKIRNNEVYNTLASSVSFVGTTVNPGLPSVLSSGLEITGNYLHDNGVTAGASGSHGGMGVSGAIMPLIYNNTVKNCYVTGAGIQTQRNKNAIICFNAVSGIRSGSPTSQYQGGLPIDGNGIFFDNDSMGGVAWGNHISDLITTGNLGSGCALAFWDCTNSTYYGNIVENTACGSFYGNSTESGNGLYNNTFINCTVGIQKASLSPPAGNITVRNNILVNCATAFTSTTAEAKIDNSYNCIYGATTLYSNVSAGANDITTVNPNLDGNYRPRATELIRSASPVNASFKDYYNTHFFGPPNFGAVEDLTDTQRYILKKA